MAISDSNVKDNLKYNYGLIFKELLKINRVQTKFYKEEFEIGKNRWASVCEGKTNFKEVDKLYEKTMIDKNILDGHKRMKISTLTDYENEDECIREINSIFDRYNTNPKATEEEIRNGDYDINFKRLFQYATSLKYKTGNSTIDKLNNIVKEMEKISGMDYIGVDVEMLNNYKNILEEHFDIVLAALTIKKQKK